MKGEKMQHMLKYTTAALGCASHLIDSVSSPSPLLLSCSPFSLLLLSVSSSVDFFRIRCLFQLSTPIFVGSRYEKCTLPDHYHPFYLGAVCLRGWPEFGGHKYASRVMYTRKSLVEGCYLEDIFFGGVGYLVGVVLHQTMLLVKPCQASTRTL